MPTFFHNTLKGTFFQIDGDDLFILDNGWKKLELMSVGQFEEQQKIHSFIIQCNDPNVIDRDALSIVLDSVDIKMDDFVVLPSTQLAGYFHGYAVIAGSIQLSAIGNTPFSAVWFIIQQAHQLVSTDCQLDDLLHQYHKNSITKNSY